MTLWLSDPAPLITAPVIPVLTIERAQDAVPLAQALLAGGLTVVEVTLRTPAALEAVRRIVAEVPDVVVAVGTVAKPLDITHAVDAGADFLVSPGTSVELAKALVDAPLPAMPGCAGSRPWPSRCPTSGSVRPAASTATTPRAISRCRTCSRSAAPGWHRRKRSRPATSPASPPAPGSPRL